MTLIAARKFFKSVKVSIENDDRSIRHASVFLSRPVLTLEIG